MTRLQKMTPALIALISFATLFSLFLLVRQAAADDGSGSTAPTATATAFDAAPATGEAPGAPVADPPIPDPIDDTGGYVGEVTSSWQRGAYLSLALVLIYGLISALSRYVAWLRVGWRKIAVTVATAALGTAVTALAQGAAPSFAWAVNILGGAILIAINGKGEPPPAKT